MCVNKVWQTGDYGTDEYLVYPLKNFTVEVFGTDQGVIGKLFGD